MTTAIAWQVADDAGFEHCWVMGHSIRMIEDYLRAGADDVIIVAIAPVPTARLGCSAGCATWAESPPLSRRPEHW